MKCTILVLSDIHFAESGANLSSDRIEPIINAISSIELDLKELLIILSGDIANSGLPSEYQLATTFLDSLILSMWERFPHLDVKTLAIPGNHDCNLPKDGEQHRKSQVDSSLTTFLQQAPDKYFIDALLAPQAAFWEFAEKHGTVPIDQYSKLCWTHEVKFREGQFRVNLFNSAVLSQRKEDRGQLSVPVPLMSQRIKPPQAEALVLSVIHHPLQWLEPDNMVECRRFLSRTSDIVITGHQHISEGYFQRHDSGERLRFYENPPLFDRTTGRSAFRLISLDLAESKVRDSVFEFRDNLYRPKGGARDWKQLELNKGIRQEFFLDDNFQQFLTDAGAIYTHPNKSRIALADFFVYPDLRHLGKKDNKRPIRGKDVATKLVDPGLHLIQGDPFSGKSALAKSLFTHYFTSNAFVPLLIDASGLIARDVNTFERLILEHFERSFTNADIEAYRQLLPSQRVVIVDNWHRAKISVESKVAIYKWLKAFAISSVLFSDKLSDLSQLFLNESSLNDALTTEDEVADRFEIIGLSHVSRGDLINNWLNLRSEADFEPAQFTRESKGIEDEISRLLGKDRLPPYAFFIICLLQAKEQKSISHIAGGSFGHLYEVLVISALHNSDSGRTPLDRKLALLSEMAAHMWRQESDSIASSEIRTVTRTYFDRFSIELNSEIIIRDLEQARIITRSGDNFRFSYAHFYYYFVAVYIRDRIDDDERPQLMEAIDSMIDHISFGMYETVIMFLIYFAKERTRIIDRLVSNASRIYNDVPPANLENDLGVFLLRREEPSTPTISEDDNIAIKRMEKRIELDAAESVDNFAEASRSSDRYAYSDDLSDEQKLHMAERTISALGQVIRNFSTRLPMSTKKKVLESAYMLGLRMMKRLIDLMGMWSEHAEKKIETDPPGEDSPLAGKSSAEIRKALDLFTATTGKIVTLICLEKLSSSVGVAEMETVYIGAMENIPESNATRLVDIKIQMDHFDAFPAANILQLNRLFSKNPFTQDVLHWLVASYLLVYAVDRTTRQKMANMIRIPESKILQLTLNEMAGTKKVKS